MDNIFLDFLKSFFLVLKAQIEAFEISGSEIKGVLGWINEEDKQEFRVIFSLDDVIYVNAKLLCDYLNNNDLVNGDSIIISEQELKSRLTVLGWNNKKAKETIDFLLSFDVKMMDDGKESDSFFLHF